MNLDTVKQFLAEFDDCVIATVNADGKPEAATVGFSHDEKMCIVVGTNGKTRKAVNLETNQSIALVVGFEGVRTLQFEGIAKQLSQQELSSRLEQHFKKIPSVRSFSKDSNQRYYLITPTWLRFTDYTKKPITFETKEF